MMMTELGIGETEIMAEFMDEGFADPAGEPAPGTTEGEDVFSIEDDLVGPAGTADRALVERVALKKTQEAMAVSQI